MVQWIRALTVQAYRIRVQIPSKKVSTHLCVCNPMTRDGQRKQDYCGSLAAHLGPGSVRYPTSKKQGHGGMEQDS